MIRKFVSLSIRALFLASSLFSLSMTKAEEPVDAYLQALQERGYTEVALRYLDRIAESDLVGANFRQEVPYRKGEFLVNAARRAKNPAVRQRYLDQAQQVFSEFVRDAPNHPDIVLARGQLGNILVERARSVTRQVGSASESEHANLNQQAYDLFQQAYESLNLSKGELGEQYKSLVSKRDSKSRKQLQQVKSQYVTTYLMLGRVLFEQAKTVESDHALYEQKLSEAAKAFDEVATKYRSFSAGLYATLLEGECYQLMGDDNRALSYFKELLQNPDQKSPVVRRLKTTALARAIEAWLRLDPQTGPDRSIQTAEEWIKTKRGNEDRSPAWLDFRFSLAKAHLAKSKIAQKDKESERALKAARDIAKELSRRRSDVQKKAQTFLVAMGRESEAPVESTSVDDVQSFPQARDAAKTALDAMKLSNTTVSILSAQLKQVKKAARRAEMESRMEQAQLERDKQALAALELFQRADQLATPEDADELQRVRYFLSYLYYTLKDYRRAAVMASHVALRYPDSVAAKECAKVAIAARQRLYQELPEGERASQMNGIAMIGELMVSRWPEDAGAGTALTTLLDVALAKGNLEQAQGYLQRIPLDSPKRAVAELRFGQQLWRQYVQSLAGPNEEGIGKTSQELKQQAQEMLEKGVERARGQAPNESVIRGLLALAKLRVDSGQPEQALELLNQDGIGAIRLIETNSRWLERIPGLAVDGYTTAIRAHIANAAVADDSQAAIRQAEDMLQSLRDTLKDRPDGQQRMIRIYVSLAQDLERQLAVAAPSAQAALSKGFESFLKKAAEGSDDIAVLQWVAQTFYSMGNGMLQGGSTSPEAQRYYTEATKAYDLVLERLKQNPELLPASTGLQLRLRQAMALRQTGKYPVAMELFKEILKEKRFLNVQVEAAKTLQQWGTVGGNTDALLLAIRGAEVGKNGQNVIWGWGRIAKLVSRQQKYADIFHDARYNIAKCRYEWGKRQSGAKKRSSIERALADLVATQKLHGLGNPSQTKRYDKLLRTVQQALGQPTTGFSKP